MKAIKEKVLHGLIKQNCFIFDGGPFTSSSGFKVPFFIDVRRLFSDPILLDEVAKYFAKVISKTSIKWIAGAETAGIPFATATSIRSGLNMFYVRKQPQDHGMESAFAGDFPKNNEEIVIIDDSVGGMGSIKIFVENLKKEKLNPTLFLYVLEMDIWHNSEERNKEFYEKEGVQFEYIVNWNEWIEYMNKNGIMSDMLSEICIKSTKNPLLFNEEGKMEWFYTEKEKGNIWYKKQEKSDN